jgi:hypothetical protein
VDRSPERDESIERLIRQSLKMPAQAGATDACLDAETLAAMMDGGLPEPALAAAQTHVADCARCQSLVGAMARVESSAPVASEHRPVGWLTWAVPLTAAAAVVAVWVALPHRNQTVPSVPAVPAVSDGSLERRAPEPPPAAENRLDQQRRTVAPQMQEAQEKSKKEPAPKADDLQKREANTVSAPVDSLSAQAETLSARSAIGAASAPRSNTQLAGADAIGPEIRSPDPMIRWRIRGRIVEHSIDGGARWDIQPTGIQAELTAGSAVSSSVVWIVGRNGVVLLSTDAGGTWRRIPFPEMTDLSSARARDARSVAVTTGDGRIFSTTDAGATWVPRPLQGF